MFALLCYKALFRKRWDNRNCKTESLKIKGQKRPAIFSETVSKLGFNCLDKHFDAGKGGSPQCAAAQNAKAVFHRIEPGAVNRADRLMAV
jgi:hypothetical protein